MESVNEDVLIRKSASGDLNAFKSLVSRYEGQVAGVVHAILGNTPVAEDIGQEVFVRFYDQLNKIDSQISIGPYLVRIATGLVMDELKRKRKAGNKSFSDMVVDGQMDLSEQLHYEISNLNSDLQSIALLRLTEGYSVEETAQIVKQSKSDVLLKLLQAQYQLRNNLFKK